MIYYVLYDIHQLTANTNVILMNFSYLTLAKDDLLQRLMFYFVSFQNTGSAHRCLLLHKLEVHSSAT